MSSIIQQSTAEGIPVRETVKTKWEEKLDLPQITWRASLAGLVIGSIVLISNFQFGLQTGWVSMMSLPSALLGFAIFKLTPIAKDFTDVENVFIQSVAVAVGTGPLAYGLIGIVPAIENFLTAEESGLGRKLVFSLPDLLIWSLGLALFGVFFAIPLRKQVIVEEKLPFPSGSATATLISVLHGTEILDEEKDTQSIAEVGEEGIATADDIERNVQASTDITNSIQTPEEFKELSDTKNYKSNISNLLYTFTVSAAYTLLAYFFPVLKSLPIFGRFLSDSYKWNFQPSPAYIGQGIIMGLPTVTYMLFGAILGWAVLAPLSKYNGWAPGDIDDWMHGGQGWILWISLSVMISDSLVSFLVVVYQSVVAGVRKLNELNQETDDGSTEPLLRESDSSSNEDSRNTFFKAVNSVKKAAERTATIKDVPGKYLVNFKVTLIGLVASSVLCLVAIRLVFGKLIPYYAIAVAIVLALFFSILGVRALGETDLNPVSGIGKLSQLIFAVVIPNNHPSKILINLVAGGIAEAGAQQAGDLMQDLKTGHLIGASPRAQFIAQLIGTMWSVVLSSVMYKVYNSVYRIPSEMFRIPTAVIWIDCSRLVTGEGLPPKAFEFSILFGVIFGFISLLKNIVPKTSKYYKHLVYLPNGVAVGIGIYNTPNFTLARFLGGALSYWWINIYNKGSSSSPGTNSKINMIIFSSGLVLGEGLLSGFTMFLTSLGVKHF
ncbi:putative oligopeptide transporter [[Candida] railenensis]|uniref:Oligopeptide transporter n=1 Tax=[Candida] railenensis TaxID=45579 RepID=A0A9P0QLA5_9ASCO|nr:putative oligopeptide transporter [[Candida] railenensis]